MLVFKIVRLLKSSSSAGGPARWLTRQDASQIALLRNCCFQHRSIQPTAYNNILLTGFRKIPCVGPSVVACSRKVYYENGKLLTLHLMAKALEVDHQCSEVNNQNSGDRLDDTNKIKLAPIFLACTPPLRCVKDKHSETSEGLPTPKRKRITTEQEQVNNSSRDRTPSGQILTGKVGNTKTILFSEPLQHDHQMGSLIHEEQNGNKVQKDQGYVVSHPCKDKQTVKICVGGATAKKSYQSKED